MSGIDTAQGLRDRLEEIGEEVLEAIRGLKQSASRENSLWLQVLIGIVSSLGAELASGAIDFAVDQFTAPSSWVRPIERSELPVLDNFFDR
ncbi:MAG: hypothetical protein KKE42_12175 [Alphaproteobacteria bacterium]|uniref:hypothetical protein n=1 Tax=Brevundimonas sp. TaxID=1871086 RepID=UPI00180B8FF2|nr:hypothetical protein [Brevundimonas sp.]MBA3049734.1 hypothetical protein [Brevundimonas sp.]MBU3974540.1 hypothetical protein [Alphaproteobacteria bacterium]